MKILQKANEMIVRLAYSDKNDYLKEDGDKLPADNYKASEFNYILPMDRHTLIYNTLYGSVIALEPEEFSMYEAKDCRRKGELQSALLSQGI
ncbi:MAG: hypothetical protein NC313_17095, partial [Butyrivibrio sp.]|nr:hypothetical protein [Butyrivibrio sp.]